MKEFNCILDSITPSKIIDQSNINDLDNFFLSLGIIFNDLKGIIFFNDLLINNYTMPIPGEINAHAGEYSGIQIQTFKLSVALISEFLKTIEKNKDVINGIKFKLIEKQLSSEIRNKWKSILSIALNNKKDSNSYLSKIAKVRSSVAYHYDHSGIQLSNSFVKRFFKSVKDESNKKAYYSIGPTMETTRFYYCDAVIHQYLNENLKLEPLNHIEKTNKLVKDMNKVIVNLLKYYLLSKKGVK